MRKNQDLELGHERKWERNRAGMGKGKGRSERQKEVMRKSESSNKSAESGKEKQ